MHSNRSSGSEVTAPYDPDFARVYDFVVHQSAEAFATDAEWKFTQWAFQGSSRPVNRRFDQEEVLRAMTVEEMVMYLRMVGFSGVEAYPDHQIEVPHRTSAEAIAFVALRP